MSKGLTLVEILITLALISFIIITVYSFKIFQSSHIDQQISKNQTKSLISQMYYRSLIYPELSESEDHKLRELRDYINSEQMESKQIVLDRRTTFRLRNNKSKMKKINSIEENSKRICAIQRIEECEVIMEYRKKRRVYKFTIPFIVFKDGSSGESQNQSGNMIIRSRYF
ncbi:MAG: prepilin-type N-terminal cleavage/methylation domain-containing protein [Candidatus Calescibacterium sp.]|nr:prepilin-type N-terminal cleavage/methylation domain-containing protein [Candidatus Calescibacterium sp.]MCX7972100.1 prepilin-type N-terminal cleavage/methylation domain-containing protein [bacterium]MDW8194788.1 prepilin-type N-terminal cleavage/methylation domain-containing protein [Candidatus Calescibacterium sp.]